jgi:hypothetical protein
MASFSGLRFASSARGQDAMLGTDKARAGDGGYGDGAYITDKQSNNSNSKNMPRSSEEGDLQADSGPKDVPLVGIDDDSDELLGVDFAESESPEGLP